MTERAIRQALIERLIRQNPKHETRLVEELGLCSGIARIDLAVINGSLQGFEIKSQDDTLKRLPAQRDAYNKVFEYLTIVSTRDHLDEIRETVPAWWSLIEAFEDHGIVKLRVLRRRAKNPALEPYAMAQLLWKDEALRALRDLGADNGMNSKSRRVIWKKLSEVASPTQVANIVKKTLKTREDWRAV